MESTRRASVGVNDLPILKLLSLEREKRVAAELLVEKEHQALLQLKNVIMSYRQRDGSGKGEVEEDNGAQVTSIRKSPERSASISSMGGLSRAFSKEFTASVFEDLPSPLQDTLDMQTILGSEPVPPSDGSPLSEAQTAISLRDDRRLREVLAGTNWKELIDEHGAQLLNSAVSHHATGCIRVLLQSGCDPNQRTPQNPCPILSVVKNGNLNALQVLIDHHANINVVDRLGYSPLYLGIQAGKRDTVETILAANPKMDVMTEYDNSVVHAAVLQNSHTLLRMLVVKLRESCDHDTVCRVLNKRNEDGSTPLHLASAEGYHDCVQVLCACNEVDVSLTDFKGKTAYDMANPSCQPFIKNRISKDVPVVMATNETNQSKLTIGIVSVMSHHTWADLLVLVHEIIGNFRNILRGGLGTGLMGTRDSPTYPISITQAKIPEELKEAVECWSDTLFDTLQITMAERSRKLAKFDIDLSSVTSTLTGDHSLNERAESEYLAGNESTNEITSGPYHIVESSDTPVEILVGLDDPVEGMAVTSLIPHTILKDYTHLVIKNRLLMIHGPPETDLSYLTYHIIECMNMVSNCNRLEEYKIPLHSRFTRDNLIGALHDNDLLERVNGDLNCDDESSSSSCVVILEGADKLPSYDLLEDMAILMKTLEKSKGVWLSLSDQSHSSMDGFVSGNYRLKNVSFCIATRVIQKSGANLPSAVMDTYSHIRLSDTEEPTSGKLLRTLLCQMVDIRKGKAFSRLDSLYQVIVWVWQFWVLYNHFMDKFDLQHLKIGPKIFLNCPVRTDNPDAVYNWFLELWNFHLVPKIKEYIQDSSFKPKSKKISRSETIRVLLLFLTQRIMQLTCPLFPEATFTLIKNLYGVGDLQHLTYPPPAIATGYNDSSTRGGSPRIMNKFKSANTLRNNTSTGSPKFHHKSMSSLMEEPSTAKSSSKQPTPQKKHSSHNRPKSGSLFGRSTLRRSLFRGSRTSLYSVDEEEKLNKKKNKPSKVTNDRQHEEQEEQAMENLLDQLLSSDKRLDEQRAVMSTTPPSLLTTSSPHMHQSPSTHPSPPASHHKISISPSESSHGSLEHTTLVHSGPKTSSQSLSEEEAWVSAESVGGANKKPRYVNSETGQTHYQPTKIEVIRSREVDRSRSRSEENVFSLGGRHSSLEDILRPTSEVSLTPQHGHTHHHHHQISNSSDQVSDSSIDSSSISTSIGYHESVPSYGGNQDIIEEEDDEIVSNRNTNKETNDHKEAEEEDEFEPLNEFNSSIVSSDSIGSRDERSLSYYAATLGLDTNLVTNRRISTPIGLLGDGGGSVSHSRRRFSSPPNMVAWDEEESVEL